MFLVYNPPVSRVYTDERKRKMESIRVTRYACGIDPPNYPVPSTLGEVVIYPKGLLGHKKCTTIVQWPADADDAALNFWTNEKVKIDLDLTYVCIGDVDFTITKWWAHWNTCAIICYSLEMEMA